MSSLWWMMCVHQTTASNDRSDYIKFEQKHRVFTALHIAIAGLFYLHYLECPELFWESLWESRNG